MARTLGEALKLGRKLLRSAFEKVEHATPDLDARLIAAYVFQRQTHHLLSDPNATVSDEAFRHYQDAIARRADGEPVARILGEKPFFGHMLKVNEHTLVPRPETEELVQRVIDRLKQEGRDGDPLTLLDIGTGSGAILIALLDALPHARGIGVDIDPKALLMASMNAEAGGLAKRAFFICGNFGDPFSYCFDVIVSNPPYIGHPERAFLPRDVLAYDPHRALFSGDDGLDAFRSIIPFIRCNLANHGFAIVEHGATQQSDLVDLSQKQKFERIQCVIDLAGHPRFLEFS